MAVPKYDEMYQQVLEAVRDGKIHPKGDVVASVSKIMGLSQDDLAEMMPNGTSPKFRYRLGWTCTYLRKSGLLNRPVRACFEITPEGKEALDKRVKIDRAFLMTFESFKKFISAEKSENGKMETQSQTDDNETPLEKIESSYKIIYASLVDDLLARIMEKDPQFFERLVVNLLQRIGYGGAIENSGMVTGQSGDEGIDGIIKEDKLGFDSIYIQAKRWDLEKSVGRPEIQKFVGALAGQGATKGLFITTASFSKDAIDYAKRQHATKVVLVDGRELASLMIEHDFGVSTEIEYKIKKLDSDFFEE